MQVASIALLFMLTLVDGQVPVMARKRPLEQIPSEISETSDGCTMHGELTELSPVKVSKKNPHVKYFTRKITKGKTM